MESAAELKVVIVGAGPAGIGAARLLNRIGIETTILEATDRIGGRVRSTVLPNNLQSQRVYADHEEGKEEIEQDSCTVHLGANWIHGLDEFNPMYCVAKKLGLTLHETSSDDEPGEDVLIMDKTELGYVELPKESFNSALERYDWVRDYLFEIEDGLDEIDNDLHKQLVNGMKESETVFGPCSDVDWRCFHWLIDRASIDMAKPLERLSLNNFTFGESDGEHGEALVLEGYVKILEYLATEQQLDIRLKHIVREIAFSESGVLVHCSNGESIHADYCIVTVPLGALNKESIEFTPSVPRAIDAIQKQKRMGLMNLVWLRFPKAFWPAGYNFFGLTRTSSDPVTFSTFLVHPNMRNRRGEKQAVLMCQVYGDFATKIESMTDREVADEALLVLRRVFGEESVPDVTGCTHSAWGKDPFAGGSWVHLLAEREECDAELESNKRADAGDHFLKNDMYENKCERVLYAGEAASKMYLGTAHGAYMSGRDTAMQIMEARGISIDEATAGI